MRLTHATAVIGFCTDLTDPEAKSLPVGTLVVGDVGDARVAAVVYAMPASVEFDDFTRAMLADVPALIRRQVDEALDGLDSDATVDAVLFRLHDALRNSLHVVTVDAPNHEELATDASPRDVLRRVSDLALDRLIHARLAAGVDLPAPESRPPIPRASPARRADRWFPDVRSWPLPRATGGRLGAVHA